MNTTEHKELNKTIDQLVRNSNGWERIDTFFKENKAIQPIYKEVERRCLDDQCYGIATIYVCVIKELLDRLDID